MKFMSRNICLESVRKSSLTLTDIICDFMNYFSE